MTDHICPSTPCPRCRDQDERAQAECDRALGAALRSPQCMECKDHGSIILGHADSQIRSRGVVQCAECRYWFHTDCIIRHFETDAAKRIVDLEACVKGRDRLLEDFAAKLAAHDATHERCTSCGRDTENDKFGQCAYCSAPRPLKALPAAAPESGCVYWFAETEEPPARYLVRGVPGVPAHLTTRALDATGFATKDQCLAACCDTGVRVLISERLVPREHMFMEPAK